MINQFHVLSTTGNSRIVNFGTFLVRTASRLENESLRPRLYDDDIHKQEIFANYSNNSRRLLFCQIKEIFSISSTLSLKRNIPWKVVFFGGKSVARGV